MKIAATHASVIVPEALTRDNYDKWSILMRHYLMGQGLWNVVESSQLPAEGNRRDQLIKENASVLHVIKVSCGAEIFDQIKGMNSAKDVWDALANMHKSPVVSQEIAEHSLEKRTDTFTAQTFGNLGRSQHKTLTDAIFNGKFWNARRIFEEEADAKSARIFENGYTALHFSVYTRQERIVDYLISKLSKDELEIQKDDFGSTALSVAARFGVGKSIAKKLVGRNSKLLSIPDNDGKIPVQLACSTIHEDMAHYLYDATPLKCLNGDCGFYILQECIIRKMFDIAFDLLRRFPMLASRSCSSGIRVKAYPIKEDEHRPDFYQSCKKKITDFFGVDGGLSWLIAVRDGVLRRYGVEPYRFSGVRPCHRHRRPIFVRRALTAIVVGPFVVPALMTFSMPLILGILILGALPMLISMLSRYFARDLYELKLMDEYAREVIHLICHQSLSKLDESQFVQSRAVEATFQAIKNGIPDIVKEIAKANDNMLWSNTDPEDSSRNIFACAIAHRQEEVARLLYEFAKEDTNKVNTTDVDRNNILHLAAKLAPPYQLDCISGSALQLQSELRWFKGVEEIVPRSYREHKNNDNKTPLEVFVGEHEDLLKKAEEWVKKTAESSTFVGALIITVTFAAAFTVPGGPDQSTGFPMLLHKTPVPFMVFMVSDAISLFAASSSVIMFLGILTSRFAYEDFLKSLPIRLVMGLSSLFISIATMTMAFCAALFIMLEGRLGVVIPITLLAGIPVTFFVVLQFPSLVEIYASTFSPNIFRKLAPSWMRIMTKMLVRLWAWVIV